jgi:glycosyltransferase involved in cell wall biosynthesis
MKIVMLTHNTVWRSTFFRCFYFARKLRALGHEVTVITNSTKDRRHMTISDVEGVEVAMMPDLLWGMGRSGWDPWNTLNRFRFMRGRAFDLVHAFDCRPTVIHPAIDYRGRAGVPLVIDWADWWGRGGVISDRKNPFLRHVFSHVETFYEEHFRTRADWTTTISTALGKRAAGLGIPADRISVISGGADIERFRPLDMNAARHQVGLPADRQILTFAGFVQYDLDLVLDSFAIVAREVPNALLVLCGPRSAVTRAWKERNPALAESVVETGVIAIERMPLYLAAADVLLLPLRDTIANRGRWPNKLGEYLAMGKPVLTNPTGDIGTLLETERAGSLAADDPVAYADAAVALLRDPARRATLGERARRVAEERLDYTLLARRLAAVYESAANVADHSRGARELVGSGWSPK